MISMSYCVHGKLTIKDGEPYEECPLCERGRASFMVHTEEEHNSKLNIGLGCQTRGTRHAEQMARKKGLTPI